MSTFAKTPGHAKTKMLNLYNNKTLSDVTLLVGDKEHQAHRAVLGASSDVFLTMLDSSKWKEGSEARITLQEAEECEVVFGDFIEYLYLGQVKLNLDNVLPLCILADKYNVKELMDLCVDFMAANVHEAVRENKVVAWNEFAGKSGHTLVAEKCMQSIMWNFERVTFNSRNLAHMTPETILNLLKCNDLVVLDEVTVLNTISKWLITLVETLVAYGEDEKHILKRVDKCCYMFLSQIRFPMMTSKQLKDLIRRPPRIFRSDLLLEKVKLGLNYHKNTLPPVEDMKTADPGFDVRIFTPRLYTCERFCASNSMTQKMLNYDSYHEFPCVSMPKYSAEHLGQDYWIWAVRMMQGRLHIWTLVGNTPHTLVTLIEQDDSGCTLSVTRFNLRDVYEQDVTQGKHCKKIKVVIWPLSEHSCTDQEKEGRGKIMRNLK